MSRHAAILLLLSCTVVLYFTRFHLNYNWSFRVKMIFWTIWIDQFYLMICILTYTRLSWNINNWNLNRHRSLMILNRLCKRKMTLMWIMIRYLMYLAWRWPWKLLYLRIISIRQLIVIYLWLWLQRWRYTRHLNSLLLFLTHLVDQFLLFFYFVLLILKPLF